MEKNKTLSKCKLCQYVKDLIENLALRKISLFLTWKIFAAKVQRISSW